MKESLAKRIADAKENIVKAAMDRRNKDDSWTHTGPREEVLDIACQRLQALENRQYRKLHEGDDPPKVGEDVYVPTMMYIDRGEDDIEGGLAEVTRVEENSISVAELPGRSFGWEYLRTQQEKLKKQFKKQRAAPDPDPG